MVLAALSVDVCEAGEELPSDVGIQLTAQPSAGLEPGEPVTVTIAVSNLGASPVELVLFDSSELDPDEFDISQVSADCPLRLFVSDGTTGFFYLYTWPIGAGDDPPLAPFETRICHLTIALAPTASQVVPLSFFLSHLYADSNPANDSSAVLLRRAAAAAVPAPTMSIDAGFALAIALILLARWRRRAA